MTLRLVLNLISSEVLVFLETKITQTTLEVLVFLETKITQTTPQVLVFLETKITQTTLEVLNWVAVVDTLGVRDGRLKSIHTKFFFVVSLRIKSELNFAKRISRSR